MTELTPIFALPMLHVGQAGKELTHNEALIWIDALLHGRAKDMLDDPSVIVAPLAGQMWIVGNAPVGDWSGNAGNLALMSGGGWRFVAPVAGFSIYLESSGCRIFYESDWQLAPQVPAIAASVNEDQGARDQLDFLLVSLANQGFIRIFS